MYRVLTVIALSIAMLTANAGTINTVRRVVKDVHDAHRGDAS